jgi:predicted HNH restriction endonuclease
MVFKKGHKTNIGRICSKETKQKISLANKGKWSWNKGRTGVYTKKQRKLMSENRKGMKFSEEHIKNLSLAHKGQKPNCPFKKGHIPWNKGKEVIQIQQEQSPHWKGGISKEPYGFEFNEKLKEYIRRKFLFRCQECFRHQNELKCPLMIHHIDYNKNNNQESNLIPLCNSCHSQTNFKRENWINYFKNKLIEAETCQTQE